MFEGTYFRKYYVRTNSSDSSHAHEETSKKWCAENVKQSFRGAHALTFGKTAAEMPELGVTGVDLWLEILP